MRRSLKCPGYSLQLRWSSKHERQQGENDSPAVPSVDNNTWPSEVDLSALQDGGVLSPSGIESRNHQDRHALWTPDSNLTIADTPTWKHATGGDSIPRIEPTGEQLEQVIASLLDGTGTTIQDPRDTFDPSTYNVTAGSDIAHIALQTPWPFDQQPDNITQGIVVPSFPTNDAPCHRHSRNTTLNTAIFQSLIDTPTALIEYWFANVCPIWSTFDSESNYNRHRGRPPAPSSTLSRACPRRISPTTCLICEPYFPR